MIKFTGLLFLLILLFSSHTIEIIASELADYPPVLNICRGINMGNMLESPYREGSWGTILKEEYLQLAKEAGFDHVRVPIRWSDYTDKNPPYEIEESFFQRIDEVIEQAEAYGLITIINVHHYEEIMTEPAKHKERFLAIWKQIAERYQDHPDTLYFEILNEPQNKLTASLWNQYLMEAIEIIRETNPDRILVVGGAYWNNIDGLRELKLPEDDRNIIVTFHYYNPFEFTHQGAIWAEGANAWLGKTWTGAFREKRMIELELDRAVKWAQENKRPLYLGEFGAYERADLESRIRWTNFVAREAEKRNIPWAYWEFNSGFGIYDPVKDQWRDELLQALIPENTD
ncbi:MAG TPA: glycoside hydrolase family 5 protein [Halanaerobiales bacterium]|nr:glycoside hydrolase family 5 protein [Halanaerobiales bacterium]